MNLAVERTRLAYERTLMAWIRTGTSLISFGFTIYKFFQEFHKESGIPSRALISTRELGMIMIVTGMFAVLLATIQHLASLKRLRVQYGRLPGSIAAPVALLVSGLGIVALIAVVFRQ